VIEHVPEAATTVAPQVFVSEKSPLTVTLAMATGVEPLLVRLMPRVVEVPTRWLPNARLAGASEMNPTAPVPPSGTVCGLVAALSVKVNVPVRVPGTVGAKLTLIVQFAVGASDAGHVFVCAKSPVTAIFDMTREVVLLLVSVTTCVALVLLTA
jgi:hypothetical protein